MDILRQVTAPSGRQLDVLIDLELSLRYNPFTIGRTWIPLVTDIDRSLRMLDRAALATLERDGASGACELAKALAKTKRFRNNGLGTDVFPEIMRSWLDFADRRAWVTPFADDVPSSIDARWITSPRGREQIKRKSAMAVLPKAIGPISGVFGIIVAAVGGATVVNQVVESNLDVILTVAVAVGAVAIYALAGLVYYKVLMFYYGARLRVAVVAILWRNGMLPLPQPRQPVSH